jgi:isoquinoline 1-oxidoreductase
MSDANSRHQPREEEAPNPEPRDPASARPDLQARYGGPSPDTIEPERYEFDAPVPYRFEIDRRDFMRVFGAAGGGLLVAVAVPRVSAQESGRGGQGRNVPAALAAWLHIDEKGHISAYTGKTEIGQNIRTSLAQAIADELRVAPEAVTMVMADTDVVPYDQGTFGSQTTPRMAPVLARAAAAARAMLIERAAAQWQQDPSTLTAADGRIRDARGRSVTFGELTKGQKLTGTVAATTAIDPASKWQVRGKPVKKADGRAFVTGAHQYSPDVVRPGLLIGRVVRPEGYSGTPTSLDDSAARRISGVTVVRDGNFLGVVAPNERVARRAASAVRAEWTPPDNPPSSVTIYEHLKKTAREGGGRGGPTSIGDVAAARAAAARVFDATYRVPYIAHVPLEPRAAVAEWTDGKLTVWCGTQRPFGVRSELAEAFRLSEDRVRVIVPDTGSAYGGKHSGEHAIEAARLAKAAGKPVKLVWTRAEEFSFAYARPAGLIEIKAAVDADGRLTAWEFDNFNSGGAAIQTPYVVPNRRIEFHPSDSPLRQGSYRGLAATANHYAREMHMDAIARALGIDAVEFRIRHLENDRLLAVLRAAAERSGWPKPGAAGRFMGIACGTEKGSYVATAAEVSKSAAGFELKRLVVVFECGAIVNPDGLKNQVEGAVVQGLGGALFEALEFANGRLTNGTMEQYRVPRFKDVPPIEVVLLDRRDLPSAGAGETPIVCVAPAIGSAVRGIAELATALPIAFA